MNCNLVGKAALETFLWNDQTIFHYSQRLGQGLKRLLGYEVEMIRKKTKEIFQPTLTPKVLRLGPKIAFVILAPVLFYVFYVFFHLDPILHRGPSLGLSTHSTRCLMLASLEGLRKTACCII
jgi:hypothetical protein